jgi:hypothetical protein
MVASCPVGHGLGAAFEIDDAEPRLTKRAVGQMNGALPVRAPVAQNVDHPLKSRAGVGQSSTCDTTDSAHRRYEETI